MSTEVGRPTELSNELLVKIRDGVIDGKTDKEICEEISVPYDTFMGWKKRNYNNFADNYLIYEHERMVKKAEKRIEQLVYSEDERVSLNASTFIAETLGKKNYSKRTELEGKTELVVKQITGMSIINDNATRVQNEEPESTQS